MPFGPDNIQRKGEASYKTIYLRRTMIEAIEQIARDNETSFNSIVVSMIEQSLKDYNEKRKEEQ